MPIDLRIYFKVIRFWGYRNFRLHLGAKMSIMEINEG